MNERIKQLALQALKQPDTDNDGLTVFDNDELKKFAELIVEECVAQCWTVSEMEHKGDVISECSKRMRKHFGVEQ
jgi:hypothetical protein